MLTRQPVLSHASEHPATPIHLISVSGGKDSGLEVCEQIIRSSAPKQMSDAFAETVTSATEALAA